VRDFRLPHDINETFGFLGCYAALKSRWSHLLCRWDQ